MCSAKDIMDGVIDFNQKAGTMIMCFQELKKESEDIKELNISPVSDITKIEFKPYDDCNSVILEVNIHEMLKQLIENNTEECDFKKAIISYIIKKYQDEMFKDHVFLRNGVRN